MTTGHIYKITNLVNKKIYIGLTKNPIQLRWKQHIDNTKSRRKKTYLSNAIIKHGKENFTIEILETVPLEILKSKEIEYIALYNSRDRSVGYNVTLGGDGCNGAPSWCKGLTKDTNESVKRVSESQMGQNNSFYNKKHSDEQKAKWKRERVGPNHGCFGKKRPDVILKNKTMKISKLARLKISLSRSKPIQCKETGEFFISILKAAEKLKICVTSIGDHLNNKQKNVQGYTFEYIQDLDLIKKLKDNAIFELTSQS